MRVILGCLVVLFSSVLSAQTYQELSERALALVEKDSLVQAEALFKQALKLEPANSHNVLLFSNLGTLQKRMGRYDNAIESFTYALNFAPKAVPILLNRATVYMMIGKNDQAYVDYCQVLDEDRKNAEALLMRAYIYTLRHDYNAARLDYNSLLEIDPINYNGRLGLAMLDQKERKFNDAIELIDKLIVDYPHDATLYIVRAGIEVDSEHIDMALIDLEKAIDLDSTLSDVFILRGDIYLLQKKKVLAKREYEKAIQLGGASLSDLRQRLQECR